MEIITKNCSLIELLQINDHRDGILNIAEQEKHIPFNIQRVYFINNLHNTSASRGFHAHKQLEQAIFSINGSFSLMTHDGEKQQEIFLDRPEKGIYLGKELWHSMSNFSEDCIILVFASDIFDESDYIRDFKEFGIYINKQID
jgi:dTDP-4-dehydrorhamnose 3,5-epimerase-like enzyme